MKDKRGNELEVGQHIIYAAGSSPFLEEAVICKVFVDKVRVGQFSQYKDYRTGADMTHARFCYLRTSYRVLILGLDNEEDIQGRDLCRRPWLC